MAETLQRQANVRFRTTDAASALVACAFLPAFPPCEEAFEFAVSGEDGHISIAPALALQKKERRWKRRAGQHQASAGSRSRLADRVASLTASLCSNGAGPFVKDVSKLVRQKNKQRSRKLRAAFDEIDQNKDGKLTEDEVRAYAIKHKLPTSYIREFLDSAKHRSGRWPWERPHYYGFASAASVALQNTEDERGPRPGSFHAPSGLSFLGALDDHLEQSIDFTSFQDFVRAKDRAIYDSFTRIDTNGDGRISMAELEKNFKQVRVLCSDSGSIKPVRKACLADMMKRMNMGRSSSISFQEFRDFFMLLPKSQYLLDYWLDASCCASGLDTGSNLQILTRAHEAGLQLSSSRGSPLNHLLAGGLAGAISRTATAPLETLRLQMMVSSTSKTSLHSAIQQVVGEAGWRGFFKGNLTNVLRSSPQKALDFFAFEAYKGFFRHFGSEHASLQIVASGALAGATSSLVLYPLDVVRSRLTVQSAQQYKGILDVFVKTARHEGIGAFYRGLRPSIIAIIPEAAITYGCFDLLKNAYKQVTNVPELGVLPALACGVTSAFTGQLVAYPFELVARRFQVGATSYKNMGEAVAHIVSKEGVGGLYRGIVPASLKVIPMAIISFGVYESVKAGLALASQIEERRCIERAALEAEKRQRHRVLALDSLVPSTTVSCQT
eukprot:SM000108S14192  [mRNA]  locus=s108:92071:95958:+ [translate_table: standard]